MRKTLLFILLFVIAGKINIAQHKADFYKEKSEIAQKWVDSIYSSMPLEDKIGQLFMVAAYTNKGEQYIEEINHLVLNEKVGGVILMQESAEEHAEWLNKFQSKVKVPLLIGLDGEWGLAQRFAGTVKFPWALTLGAITNDSLVYEAAKHIALHCKRMGIHWNYAPVVDVNINPNNPIIGNRSFGSDKNNVVKKALAYMRGLQEQKILSSAKHFPGHGDTNVDSHHDLPMLKHSKKRLDSLELFPFKQLINKGVDGVMVSHLNILVYEPNSKVPATLSYKIITQLLKEELGFDGLIVTDALNMQGIAKYYPYGEMDYLAFKAGNDILLFSQGVALGQKKIKEAIEKGEISMERLEESVKKILYAKYHVGLYKKYEPINIENLKKELDDNASEVLKQKLFAAAITEYKSTENYFPLKKNKKYLYLPLEGGDNQLFYSNLQRDLSQVKMVTLADLNSGKYNPKEYELIIGIHKDTDTTVYYSPKLAKASQNTITRLSKKYPVTLCNFISPYSLNGLDISYVKNVIITYQNNKYTQNSILDVLNGTVKATGTLPVTIVK